MTDQFIRQWVLNDSQLYTEAVVYGMRRHDDTVLDSDEELPSGDECMYAHIYDFIAENRERLTVYINERLQKSN